MCLPNQKSNFVPCTTELVCINPDARRNMLGITPRVHPRRKIAILRRAHKGSRVKLHVGTTYIFNWESGTPSRRRCRNAVGNGLTSNTQHSRKKKLPLRSITVHLANEHRNQYNSSRELSQQACQAKTKSEPTTTKRTTTAETSP